MVTVAFIGAGSVGFTRTLVRDLLAVPELADTQLSLHDINEHNLDMIRQLIEKDIKGNQLPATVSSSVDRRRALDGADYVINCTRIGGLEAFRTDIEIPLAYRVDQCVGDTLSAGGIMYGQRNIPNILDFCRDIRQVAAADALFLNYANPMAMNTWAALDTGVATIGLCHGIEGGHRQIAEVLGANSIDQVNIICAGINHQTWYVRILYQGRLVSGEELLEAFERHPTYSQTEKVRIDVLRRFGYYSTESNGHLSEYLPWYRKRPDEIVRWIDLSRWINGETGGYLRVSTESRNWFETDFPEWLHAEDPPISPQGRSSERGSYIIEALETGRVWRGHLNVRNEGCIPNLAADAIVEVPAYIDRNGISIPKVGDLPLACAATCTASIDVQRMSVAAALSGDVTLLKQAMLHDPLVGAVCNPDEVWQMVDDLLVAQAQWLPQYRDAIPAARQRLAAAPPPPAEGWEGAARLPTRSLEQLRADPEARRVAAAADKGTH